MADGSVLPQLGSEVFLTDGGIETDLIFRRGVPLPEFASFVMHDSPESEAVVGDYFEDYLQISSDAGLGLVLETLTWRASADWGAALGYDSIRRRDVNRRAAEFLLGLRERHDGGPVVISGCVGPRDDAYSGMGGMSVDDAAEYHHTQVSVLVDSGVDMISALTLTNTDEAIGVVRAASSCGAPVVISFTVETDGRLPTGASLASAIRSVDEATDAAATYYMVNCAHHDHLVDAVLAPDPALARIRGVRANASRLGHAELDRREDLDDGDPAEFGAQLAALSLDSGESVDPTDPGRSGGSAGITVMGGCCGTDSRHIAAIARSLNSPR